jgi:hypothetical protein
MTYPTGILIRLTVGARFLLGDLGSEELRRGGPRGAEHIAEAATTLHQRSALPGRAP